MKIDPDSSESSDADFDPWQRTFEKQRRVLLKREQAANPGTVGSEALGTSLQESNVPAAVEVTDLPPRPVSPHFIRFLSGRDLLTQTVTNDSLPFSASSVDEYSDGETAEELICQAMTSLNFSSLEKSPGSSASSQHPPGCPNPTTFKLPSATPGKRKYYVVSVGKCTGVFDSWPFVQRVTSGVGGNCQVSYTDLDEARSCYLDLKQRGLVRIVRTCGDDMRFGPVSKGMQ